MFNNQQSGEQLQHEWEKKKTIYGSYSEEVDSAGGTFFPLLVESYGLWSDDSLIKIIETDCKQDYLKIHFIFWCSFYGPNATVYLFGYGSIMLE